MKSTPPSTSQAAPRGETSNSLAPITLAGLRIAPGAVPRWLPLVLILLAGTVLRLVLLARDVPTLNSDEAVVGLMGMHALHGDFYVFYWGQEYMGSLEAWLVAPFLALFGASAFTLRLATLALSLAFVATTYRLGAQLYSRGVGLAAAALLAIGPPFFTVVGLRTWGGYIETLVFGDLLLSWNLATTLSVTPRETATPDHGILVYGRDDELLALLRAHHVRTVLSNDYWEGFKLAFESGEQIIVPMVEPNGHPGFNRYKPYLVQGLKDPRPAYLELLGTPEAQEDLDRLHAGRLPGYSAHQVGEFSVLVPR